MKAEKTLKIWSIVTLCFSMILLASLFFTFFAALTAGSFYLEFYEEFTNDLGGDPSVPYKLFFQIELYSLMVFVICNQILMWARSIVLKRNDKSLRSEIDTLRNPKTEKKEKNEVSKKEDTKKEKEETIKKETEKEEVKNTEEKDHSKKEKRDHKKEEEVIKEETVTVTKTTTVKRDPRKDKINSFLNKNRY